MQKKSVLPRNQNVVDLMQLALREYARYGEKFGGQRRSKDMSHSPWRVCTRLESHDSFRKWDLTYVFAFCGSNMTYISNMQNRKHKN